MSSVKVEPWPGVALDRDDAAQQAPASLREQRQAEARALGPRLQRVPDLDELLEDALPIDRIGCRCHCRFTANATLPSARVPTPSPSLSPRSVYFRAFETRLRRIC